MLDTISFIGGYFIIGVRYLFIWKTHQYNVIKIFSTKQGINGYIN